ncbi:MAG: hypothetical protein JWM68_817 [Verrucomicrobiales bacterium]|nr:hypothetical protein [Verrucomicrobiales bacterium]
MKTIQITLAALTLAIIALTSTGCMTRGERISEPSGAGAAYRNGEWEPVDESKYIQVPSNNGGYYDSGGVWHGARH